MKRLQSFVFIVMFLNYPISFAGGERYEKEGHALGAKIYEVLIQKKFCLTLNDCQKKEVLYGESGDRVYLNLYGIQDREIISDVLQMVLSEGIKTTKGAPITISVYQKQKNQYLGLKSALSPPDPTIRLVVNE